MTGNNERPAGCRGNTGRGRNGRPVGGVEMQVAGLFDMEMQVAGVGMQVVGLPGLELLVKTVITVYG